MLYCAKHDITYPPGGSCWCCDAEKKHLSPEAQESDASAQLAAAQKALDAAKQNAETTSIDVQKQLDQKVSDLTQQLGAATAEAEKHRASMLPPAAN